MPEMCCCVKLPAYCKALLAVCLIFWRTGGWEPDAAEGPGITVYPSVLRLVCDQSYDMHVAATTICTQLGWEHSMNCHALGHPFAAPLAPPPPSWPPLSPFNFTCSPFLLAHSPPVKLPFVSPIKTSLFDEARISCLQTFEQKQYLPSLKWSTAAFTDKLVWWFQSKSKGKSRFAPAGSAGEGEEEDSPNSRKPACPDLHAWSRFNSVNWLSMAPCPMAAH